MYRIRYRGDGDTYNLLSCFNVFFDPDIEGKPGFVLGDPEGDLGYIYVDAVMFDRRKVDEIIGFLLTNGYYDFSTAEFSDLEEADDDDDDDDDDFNWFK